MCGIIGYVGTQQALPIILEGLRRMEYRGYDSAGVSIMEQGRLFSEKRAGRIGALEAVLDHGAHPGTAGIGHIRWATHGVPSDINAHPHYDCVNEIHVVHNEIGRAHV